jgi:hypothetical protein
MSEHISQYDKTKAVIVCLEVLEISGDNPMVDKIQAEANNQLKEYLKDCEPQYLIGLLLRVRESARNKKN